MRSATVHEIKDELVHRKPAELIALCMRLAKFKKENKELLTYLLFEAHDEESYIRGIKEQILELFGTINQSHLYFAKKTLRKIVRVINTYSRYSGNKQTDMELRIYFCEQLIESGIPFRQSPVISNLYDGQVKKIVAVMAGLHEDLQHDYQRAVNRLAGSR
ncbi:MAG: hypothetical protein IPP93_02995 [Chitinophagaceae bacterium]|nr:hypothetical protein [Chitinophagaceae bacterium]